VLGRSVGRIEADLEGFARDLRELLAHPGPDAHGSVVHPATSAGAI
jgi:hypothetical protein